MALWLTIDFSYTVYSVRGQISDAQTKIRSLYSKSRKCAILLSLISVLVCGFSGKPWNQCNYWPTDTDFEIHVCTWDSQNFLPHLKSWIFCSHQARMSGSLCWSTLVTPREETQEDDWCQFHPYRLELYDLSLSLLLTCGCLLLHHFVALQGCLCGYQQEPCTYAKKYWFSTTLGVLWHG